MFTQEISIALNSKADKEDILEEFDMLMAFYRSSGQTQGKIESQYMSENRIVCLPFTLEKNSLDAQYNNFYVNQSIGKLEALCNSKLQYKTLGKTHPDYKGACKCKQPEFYILTTNYLSIYSPITCGSCFKSVPLYRLPKYNDHSYMNILSWESNYIACDTLQMNCYVGEHWALNQMQEVKSQLSRQGLEICRRIEALTQVPTYYYLHNYRKVKGDQYARLCPGCNGPWLLKQALHDFYDFKCDQCKLVSTISTNSG